MVGSTGGGTTTFTDSGLTAGTTYGYHVTARDAAGNVSAPSGVLNLTTNSLPKLHISAISIVLRSSGSNRYARAVITVVNENGTPKSGATVTAQWSGLANDTDTGVTSSTGRVQFDSNRVHRSASGQFIVTVTNVSAPGFTYDPSANARTAACVSINGSLCSVGP